jgi:hypothetical protein
VSFPIGPNQLKNDRKKPKSIRELEKLYQKQRNEKITENCNNFHATSKRHIQERKRRYYCIAKNFFF